MKKPKWRWLLLPLSPIAIPIGFAIGLISGIVGVLRSRPNHGGDPPAAGELELEQVDGDPRGAPPADGELELEHRCPKCGSEEIEASSPRTTYSCGSSDYDQRPGTFQQSTLCKQRQ